MGDVERHVTVAGAFVGEYVIDEQLADGRIVIRPDTSASAIRRRAGLESIGEAEFSERFGSLAVDDEG